MQYDQSVGQHQSIDLKSGVKFVEITLQFPI